MMEKIIYRKGLAAKLIENRGLSLEAYQSLKDSLNAHADIKTRFCFDHDTILFNKKKVGMIRVLRKNLALYLALDAKKYLKDNVNIEDLSEKKAYQKTPLMITVKNKKALDKALELLELLFTNLEANELVEVLDVDYNEEFYERSFETMLSQGLIKKYVRKRVEGKYVEVEALLDYKVTFNAELKYEACGEADNLFILTNVDNWDFNYAIKMTKVADNKFTAEKRFLPNTKLEFKICRADSWEAVEKGIWKEEIVNHHYLIVDKDLEVEDLIYNFR